MRVGICDDNAADAKKIAFALEDISADLELVCYDTGAALLDAVKGGAVFDLVFLDIFLARENGMELAEALRQISPDTDLVFSTTSRDFAVEAFRVQAADYLVKPYAERDVVNAFARVVMKRKNQKPDGVLLQVGRELRFFRPEEIVRIESDRHYTRLLAANGTETRLHLNYSEVVSRFPKTFLELRRGITVNMAFIGGIKGNLVTLTDGSTCNIPKSKLDRVVGSYTRYVTGAR